jgi:hypothetical protein
MSKGDVMAEPKTKPTTESVSAFLDQLADKNRREDCLALLDIMKDVTKEEPEMWGSSIVGCGRYRHKYANGSEAEWPIAAFSPRKGDLTLYITPGLFEESPSLMKRLGKHKTSKSCLYIKKLADVDSKVLREIVEKSVKKLGNKRIQN